MLLVAFEVLYKIMHIVIYISSYRGRQKISKTVLEVVKKYFPPYGYIFIVNQTIFMSH